MSRAGFEIWGLGLAEPQPHCLVFRVAKHVNSDLQQVCITDFQLLI